VFAEKGVYVVQLVLCVEQQREQTTSHHAAREQSKGIGPPRAAQGRSKEGAVLPWWETDAKVLVTAGPEGNIDRSS
jgi:hypothetical protein